MSENEESNLLEYIFFYVCGFRISRFQVHIPQGDHCTGPVARLGNIQGSAFQETDISTTTATSSLCACIKFNTRFNGKSVNLPHLLLSRTLWEHVSEMLLQFYTAWQQAEFSSCPNCIHCDGFKYQSLYCIALQNANEVMWYWLVSKVEGKRQTHFDSATCASKHTKHTYYLGLRQQRHKVDFGSSSMFIISGWFFTLCFGS